MSHCYHANIERDTETNENFRKVEHTGAHLQVVLMHLRPDECIGMEVHPGTDQFIRVDAGDGYALIDGERYPLKDGMAIVIPAGSRHDVHAGASGMKLYAVYSNQTHPRGEVTPAKGMKSPPMFRPTEYLQRRG